jgi:hAT family C-terminal dimerisation region
MLTLIDNFLEINSSRFPVWASLAKDYLSIMGSSVSSERAFSSAGITITKRRNRLQADIVEALQFLKCLLRKDLIYREPQPSSILEQELGEVLEDDGNSEWVDDVDDPTGWDKLFIDAESDSED